MDTQIDNGKGAGDGLGGAWEVDEPAGGLKGGPVSKAFLLAGNAHFTVSNPTGTRFTYRIVKVEPDEGSPYKTPAWFASVLTGPDNERHYTYLGMIQPDALVLRLTKGSKRGPDDLAVKVLIWALYVVSEGKPIREGYAIHHEGKCGRCGRLLTVPSSVILGLGPECAGKV
jgi:hypothetical protein